MEFLWPHWSLEISGIPPGASQLLLMCGPEVSLKKANPEKQLVSIPEKIICKVNSNKNIAPSVRRAQKGIGLAQHEAGKTQIADLCVAPDKTQPSTHLGCFFF